MRTWALLYCNTYHSKFLLVACSTLKREERTVVSDLALPLTMEIVRHHVNEVLENRGNKFEIVEGVLSLDNKMLMFKSNKGMEE